MNASGCPSTWISRYLPAARPGQRLLDVACGSGRHLRLALERGWIVTGIDRNLTGVNDLDGRDGVELIPADLEIGAPFPLDGRQFDAVVVTNYLWRPILSEIVAAVALGGILLYETFAAGNARYGRPSNPDFLLQPGELIDAVRPRLTTIAYEHATLADPPGSLRVLPPAARPPLAPRPTGRPSRGSKPLIS